MKMPEDASIQWYETLQQSGESTNEDNDNPLDKNRNWDDEPEF
jgi:hypothetical protein